MAALRATGVVVSLLVGSACAASLILPDDAPVALRTNCGWPATTPLSFAGPVTRAQLGIADRFGRLGSPEVVYAIVTRDRVTLGSHGGSITGRGLCYATDEGTGVSVVPDDWQLR
jgi:hypothetical protein